MRIHHAGKMGDLIYALPVMKSLARRNGVKIDLITSALCWQLVPLLWEQSYIASVTMDEKPYKMQSDGMSGWDYFSDPLGGLNLSPQPAFMEPTAPIPWTECYMRAAGITALSAPDTVAFPSLVNHRRWHYGHEVCMDGVPVRLPQTMVLAPESESVETAPLSLWKDLAVALRDEFNVIVVGCKQEGSFFGCTDLRGLTTVPTMARMIAEARGFIGALSLPFHLARHSEVPTICLQHMRPGLVRSIPVDTDSLFAEPDNWRDAVARMKDLASADALKTRYV